MKLQTDFLDKSFAQEREETIQWNFKPILDKFFAQEREETIQWNFKPI